MIRRCLTALTILLLAWPTFCGAQPKDVEALRKQAVTLYQSGRIAEAAPLMETLSEHGDHKATTTLGLMYHTGQGKPQDYDKAISLYLSVWDVNGDAANNLGVMFRDGQGVEVNRKVATAIFYSIYASGSGSMDTQVKAGRNLSRELRNMNMAERRDVGCYALIDIMDYVESRGKKPLQRTQRASAARLRDHDEEGFFTANDRGEIDIDYPCLSST